MSVIAINGIPAQFSLVEVVKKVGKVIGGPFIPMNFLQHKNSGKTCFLRLSEKLDPAQVVQRISSTSFGSRNLRLTAYVPDEVPEISMLGKKKKVPRMLWDKLKLPELEMPHEAIVDTHQELFLEIQYKYPGLYNLSRKTSHKLLDTISRTIGERLIPVMEANRETRESSFKLSMFYRKKHPHFGDFQFILSTLHALQDAAGAPRSQLNEQDLLAPSNLPPMMDQIPLTRIKAVCTKFNERVARAYAAHVNSLETALQPGDSDELIARKKVREELVKMKEYIPQSLRQLTMTHFVPEEQPQRRVRIYGEPFLPPREAMAPLIRRYKSCVGKMQRSRKMYNLLMFRVANEDYAPLRALDSTVINGAKLSIRTDQPIHRVHESLRAELAAHYGGTPRPAPNFYEGDDDEDDDDGGDE